MVIRKKNTCAHPAIPMCPANKVYNCLRTKAQYVFKQAVQAWFAKFHNTINQRSGFSSSDHEYYTLFLHSTD